MIIYYDKISYISKLLEVDPAIKGIGDNILWEFRPGETFLLLLKVRIIEIWWSHNLLYMRYDRKVILLEDLANRRRSSFRWKFSCNLKLTMLRPQINFKLWNYIKEGVNCQNGCGLCQKLYVLCISIKTFMLSS